MSDAITVYGIDFTSRPRPRKPITCLQCLLDGDVLNTVAMHAYQNFNEFEEFLAAPPAGPPSIAAIDMPFGMPLRFIKNMGWPINWADYIDQNVVPLDRDGWRMTLEDYKRPRPYGDKQHRRRTDIPAGSVSPQTLYRVPVGLMFFEGVPRLRAAGVMIPGLQDGRPDQVVVEAYPGVAVRSLVGQLSYKAESPDEQTDARREARELILERLMGDQAVEIYDVHVRNTARLNFIQDATGDHLDALLCSVQAAWAWRSGAPNFGLPLPICPTEGWIADPAVR